MSQQSEVAENIFIFLFRETAKLLQEAAEIKVKH